MCHVKQTPGDQHAIIRVHHPPKQPAARPSTEVRRAGEVSEFLLRWRGASGGARKILRAPATGSDPNIPAERKVPSRL